MNTLLNHNGKQATININTAYDKENNVITSALTWSELTDSDKQDIASEWIRDHIYTNVNQVMELLAQNEDHDDYDDYHAMSESKDFTNTVESDLQDKTIDELIEIIEEYDLDVEHSQVFKDDYLSSLLENAENANIDLIEYIFDELEESLHYTPRYPLSDYSEAEMKREMLTFLATLSYSLDDLDSFITNLGINFEGYLEAYKSDLITLIEKKLDFDQYGEDNNLEPEYDQAYEFYSVSDHFKAMLPENCEDLLGLTVWARFCTGQSICLDYQVQVAAFKVLSDCSYENY